MFNGTLGIQETDTVYPELSEGAEPICPRPYPATKLCKEMSKKEVERLVILGVLELENNSEWGAHPSQNLNLKQIG